MSCQNECNSNSAIEQAVNDALADRITDLDGFSQGAKNSAEQSAASATKSAQSAEEAKGYRDQAQGVANTAAELVPDLLETSINLKSAADTIDIIAQTASSFLVRNIFYTVVGGENSFTFDEDEEVAAVQAIYIEGVRQDKGYGYTYDVSTRTVTFAETFTAEQAGTVLTIQAGKINADSPETALSLLQGAGGAGLIKTTSGKSVQEELTDQADAISDNTDALALKAPLASPQFTGTPKVPNVASLDANDQQAANTAFVQAVVKSVVANLVDSSPEALDTLNELAAALGDDPNFAATMTAALGLKAPLASPSLTGTPTAPTPAAGTNNTQIATTAFVTALTSALTTALTNKAAKGTNNDITNLTGLTTPLSIAQGGRGQNDVSYVRAEDLTPVSIGYGTFTLLSPAEVTDTKNAYLTGTWTCPADGYYQISASVRFGAPATPGCVRMVKIDSSTAPSNGAVLGQTSSVCSGADQLILQVNSTIQLTAGTKLSMYAYHNDSTVLSVVHKALQILRVA